MALYPVGQTPAATGQSNDPLATESFVTNPPGPVTITEAVGSSALTLTGATQTTSQPVLNMTQTWNNASTVFAGIKLNVTNTASNSNSNLIDLQNAGSSKFSVGYNGLITCNGINTSAGITTGGGFVVGLAISFTYSGGFAYITSPAIAKIQIGALDAAAPVAQTLSVQSVVAGTTNTAGTNFTIAGSQGTGTGIGGDIIFQVAPASTTGSTQNTLVQALRVYNNKTVIVGSNYTVATLPTAGTQGRRAWVTDATAPTFGGALVGGGAVVIPVFDNGTAWVSA